MYSKLLMFLKLNLLRKESRQRFLKNQTNQPSLSELTRDLYLPVNHFTFNVNKRRMATKPTMLLTMNHVLWVAQAALASVLIWTGITKFFQPVEVLAAMWPWTGQIPYKLVQLTGVLDILGATGLIVPALLRIQPKLTPLAALGIIVLMGSAIIFHISRGEASLIRVNIIFALLAAFIAWGRFFRVPISPQEVNS